MLARSLPAFGSENPGTTGSSTDWIFGKKRCFCSGVPNWTSVGATGPRRERDPRGALALAYSSLKMICSATFALRPPYSSGT